VFVISHDDRYFHLADRLIKLENGAIVEQTSYEELPHTLTGIGVPLRSGMVELPLASSLPQFEQEEGA